MASTLPHCCRPIGKHYLSFSHQTMSSNSIPHSLRQCLHGITLRFRLCGLHRLCGHETLTRDRPCRSPLCSMRTVKTIIIVLTSFTLGRLNNQWECAHHHHADAAHPKPSQLAAVVGGLRMPTLPLASTGPKVTTPRSQTGWNLGSNLVAEPWLH